MRDEKIMEAVEMVNLRKPETFQAAANLLLTEEMYVKAGDNVAVIQDPTYPLAGQRCRVVGISAKGSGWVDVETENGTKMPVQSSLLLKV